MIIDMAPMLRGEVRVIDFDYKLTPEEMPDVEFTDDASVTGRITDDGGYMQLTARVSVPYTAECARCLDPVSGVFEVEFERLVAAEGSLSPEQIEDNVDKYVIVSNKKLDIDPELRDEMVMNFPLRFLCSEDCPGLCPKCGKPKRLGDCGCRTHEPDPRWAVLGTLLTREGEPESDTK